MQAQAQTIKTNKSKKEGKNMKKQAHSLGHRNPVALIPCEDMDVEEN